MCLGYDVKILDVTAVAIRRRRVLDWQADGILCAVAVSWCNR